jgi:thioredoxin reductase (NADPH)
VGQNEDRSFDVLVVGGGPAGLAAALQLARFDRQVALFDAGQGRSTWHQTNHNYIGFPGGISARELRERGRQQLGEYEQVVCLDHKIESLGRDDGWFVAAGQAGAWRGRAVILATGVVDHYPHFEGWDECVGRSMFWCINCDGYACKGYRVVVAGNTNETASETLQLQRFTDQLTVLTNSYTCEISDEFLQRLDAAGIPVIHDKIGAVTAERGVMRQLLTEGGRTIELDQLFSVQGATPQSDLAAQLGARIDHAGFICVDTEQKTDIPGLFAAGDVTDILSHQIATAVHEGLQAASAANYFLYPAQLRDEE